MSYIVSGSEATGDLDTECVNRMHRIMRGSALNRTGCIVITYGPIADEFGGAAFGPGWDAYSQTVMHEMIAASKQIEAFGSLANFDAFYKRLQTNKRFVGDESYDE